MKQQMLKLVERGNDDDNGAKYTKPFIFLSFGSFLLFLVKFWECRSKCQICSTLPSLVRVSIAPVSTSQKIKIRLVRNLFLGAGAHEISLCDYYQASFMLLFLSPIFGENQELQ